jgi:alpha-galactosidase
LRFGIWVEPERVDAATVGRPGLVREEWLAKNNNNYGSDTPQVCLASDAARAYLFDRLTQLLDDVRPDYLKWDNNVWVNCNRSGHGHGANDGNFRHVEGLYAMLGDLRARYPDMEIENCSQGGNRLDLGMMRYTSAAWMDDRTFPSVHVRHNLEGLMTVFPPAYLLSFVMGAIDEPLSADAADLALYTRSRMPGILGLSYRASDLSDADRQALAAEIALYKSFRTDLAAASGRLLGEQASQSPPPWDVVQETSATSGNAVVFAFQNDSAVRSIVVQPEGLDGAAMYLVTAPDGSFSAAATGAELMDDGLQVDRSAETDAQLFTLRKLN